MKILTTFDFLEKYKSAVEFLYNIYKTSYENKRFFSSRKTVSQEKLIMYNKIVNLAISYGLMCFQEKDLFFKTDIKSLVYFFVTEINEVGTFLTDIINESIKQNSLKEFLNLFIFELSTQLHLINIDKKIFVNYLSVFENFIIMKPVASIFYQIDNFFPKSLNNSLDFENKTILGSLLKLSPFNQNASIYYFNENFNILSSTQQDRINETLQNDYKLLIERLFFIFNNLIRGSVDTRQSLLKWFSITVNLSHLRRGDHSNLKKLPSDAFMFNITLILIKLSLPFLDYPYYLKIDKININFFSNDNLIDISDELRINSSINESNAYFESHKDNNGNNFISECFFLTLSYTHYGLGGIFLHYNRLKNQIKQINEKLKILEDSEDKGNLNQMFFHILGLQISILKKSLNVLQANKNAIKAIFFLRSLQLEIFDFVIGTIAFMNKLIDPSHQYPKKKFKIPFLEISKVSQLDDQNFLQSISPSPWKNYPEFILESIVNYCKFTTIFKGCPMISNDNKMQFFMDFAITILKCHELCGNPYIKANIIEILFIGTLPFIKDQHGFISPFFTQVKIIIDNILNALLDFYIVVEKTGSSSQFYDKFNIRYYILYIIDELWNHEIYRDQLHDYFKKKNDFFTRFIGLMLNDVTYLFDESFNEVNLIHDYQIELKQRRENNINSDYGTDDELNQKLTTSEKKAKTYLDLSNKTIKICKLFTKEVPRAFVIPEIIDRLANMLNYNLSVMVGPKCSNLKVENPEKYGFNPKKTLCNICEIFSNLSNEEEFYNSVSKDSRSFNINYFKKAEIILRTKTHTNIETIKIFIEFAYECEKRKRNQSFEETQLGDIPDEFLDPILYTLMDDPVILPTSRVTVNRSTIKAHLLSDPIDPFNRVPLKIDDVIDDVELKQKIEEFKKNKLVHNA